MQVWEMRHARAQAMLKADDGDLPGARRDLDSLIGDLTVSARQAGPELAAAYIDRATIARFSNDWDGALSDLASAEAIANALPLIARQSLLTDIHLVRAKIYSTSFVQPFDPARAQSSLDQLAQLRPDSWIAEELESHVAFQMGDWERAASKALHAASALESQGWARGAAACRRRAGEALLELGRLDGAAQQLSAAREFFDAHGPPDLLSDTQLVLAVLESRLGNHDEAWALAERVLGEVESRVRRFVDVAGQQRFLLDKLRFYDRAFDIALARDTSVGWLRAWTVAERSKSFYLAHLLANADIPLFEGVDPKCVRTIEALELELDCCERKLGTLAAADRGGPVERSLEARLHELSDARSDRLRSIMTTNPRWARLRNPPPFDATDLARTLAADVRPVSYFWRDSPTGAVLHVFALATSSCPLHAAVKWERTQLEELAGYAQRLHGHVDDYAPLLPDEVTDRVLPPAIRNDLPVGACLLISSHGRLRGLPLHALPLDESIVIDRWPVQYVPSLALPSPVEGASPGASVLLMGSADNAFGDAPLFDVEAELSGIEQVWKRASRPVVTTRLAADATPNDAGWPPHRWSEFGVLHFACHGRFDEGRPFDSALRLGGDAVRASELFATKLNATVVALSACALGQRAERYGSTEVVSEEWIGLYLPLFYAGARSLVVSLWDANSQVAREFMLAFHGALAMNEKPHMAFQTAVRRLRSRLTARWANWCLVGLPI